MRKFYVTYYSENFNIVQIIIDLNTEEKANDATFHSKINKLYDDTCGWEHYCNKVLSWSLIEE